MEEEDEELLPREKLLRYGVTLLKDDELLALFEALKNLALHLLRSVDDEQDQVCILRARPGGGDHRPVETPFRGEDARSVDEEDLRLVGDGDAHQPGAGRLCLGTYDRDLLTN